MRSLLLVITLSLSACGQPGDLYLPESETAEAVPGVEPEASIDPLDQAGADEPEDDAEDAESMDGPAAGPGL
jgi:predicted small lipoprotein YifL